MRMGNQYLRRPWSFLLVYDLLDRLRTESVKVYFMTGSFPELGTKAKPLNFFSMRSLDLLTFRIRSATPLASPQTKCTWPSARFRNSALKFLNIKSIFCPLSAISVMAFKAMESSAPMARAPKYITPKWLRVRRSRRTRITLLVFVDSTTLGVIKPRRGICTME